MTVALRAHHLLCTLTYVGEGYSAAFVANYDGIAARLAGGECIRIVDGPDDVCAPLRRAGDGRHCLGAHAAERDRRAARDLEPLTGCPMSPGARLRLDAASLARLRSAFAEGSVRAACRGCEWRNLCTRVAHRGYLGTRV